MLYKRYDDDDQGGGSGGGGGGGMMGHKCVQHFYISKACFIFTYFKFTTSCKCNPCFAYRETRDEKVEGTLQIIDLVLYLLAL